MLICCPVTSRWSIRKRFVWITATRGNKLVFTFLLTTVRKSAVSDTQHKKGPLYARVGSALPANMRPLPRPAWIARLRLATPRHRSLKEQIGRAHV